MHELRAAASSWLGEWQLRGLVLTSLALQYVMWFTAGKRKFSTPTWFRIIFVQLLFVASDAVALYALATLFNRQKFPSATQRNSSSSSDLEVLWAPFLLMHIGGYAVSTISSIDGSDKWERLTLVTMTKGAVALYLFYKSWKSIDKRLLAAAILLFVAQVRKVTHKFFYLKFTSFDAMRKQARHASPSSNEDKKISPEKFIEEVSVLVPSLGQVPNNEDNLEAIGRVFDLSQTLCLDKAITIRDRLVCLKYLWFLSDGKAYKLVEDALSRIFSFYYTRDLLADILYNLWKYTKPVYYINFCLITLMRLAPIIISISLFHMSQTKDYSPEDVLVTFVLFYGTVLLDLGHLFLVVTFPLKWEWPRIIAQNSLLGYYIYKQQHPKWMFIAEYFKFQGRLKMQHSCDSCKEILALVQQHVKDGWLHGIKDVEEYKEFNNTTGQWTLKRENCNQLIEWSSRYPMDESVLIWHVATDLCFYLGSPSADNGCAKRSREMSNYMVYLLHAKPDMLNVGSRSVLLADSVKQLESLLSRHRRHGTTIKYVRGRDVALDLIAEQWEAAESSVIIGKAWELAQRLRGLNDEAKMWRVIQGVWVEMLCFSAARCPSKVHARNLGSGGEYLSYVWLLQAYAGLETFPDKIQKRHLGSVFESSEL